MDKPALPVAVTVAVSYMEDLCPYLNSRDQISIIMLTFGFFDGLLFYLSGDICFPEAHITIDMLHYVTQY